ncbi:regulatory protein RecX [Gordonia soli]|uniref:Regulatory protein RecX n=1 Tax=Gordonia soli NBRC 108243 TaxID=1223545 RepID=M0QQ66_9ACTN|nr:regulatory protein RecX [Gordonia soli]GAC70830.1 regulatory protein RecX [Gordonia soli NBRC 108243]
MRSADTEDDAAPGRGGERQPPSAWDAALRLLGVRARSRQEMRDRLTKKGFEPAVVDDVMTRLDRSQLLDDDDFATEWVRSRHMHSGRGRVALRQELRQKGVDSAIIENALEEIDPAGERAIAARLVERKLSVSDAELAQQDRVHREKVFRRLAGMLLRRGYPQSLAIEVVEQVLAETSAES